MAVLAALNVVGVKESARLNVFLALADFVTQLVLVVIGLVLVFSPDTLVNNVDFGISPTLERLPDRDPGGDGRLHRHRDDLEHGRGGTRLRQDDPARHRRRGRRGRGDLRLPAGDSAVGDAGRGRRDGDCESKEEGGFADDPILGVVENMDLGRAPGPGRDLRRHPRRDDPFHRDQRRPDRRLAPDLLDGPAPPAAGGPAPGSTPLPHAVHRDRRLRARRLPDDPSGQAEFLGRSTPSGRCCRSRSRTWRSSRCASSSPTTSGPGAARSTSRPSAASLPLFAIVGGLGTGHRLGRRHGAERRDADRRLRSGWRSGSPSTCSTGATRA